MCDRAAAQFHGRAADRLQPRDVQVKTSVMMGATTSRSGQSNASYTVGWLLIVNCRFAAAFQDLASVMNDIK